MPGLNRRAFVAAAAAGSLASPACSANATSLNFDDSGDTLTAWMKLHTRVSDGSLYYWYRARHDMALPGQPIQTLVGYDTLYRYTVKQVADEAYEVTRWETSIYTDPNTNEPADEIYNPYNNRTVRPYHFKEGPVTYLYSRNKPRIIGSAVLGDGDEPFQLDWTVVGDEVWVSNEVFVSYPHPLKPNEWPLESSGDMLTFSNISTLRGSVSAIEDPTTVSAPCYYSYQATSGWLPWMLMGQTPGHTIWRAQGAKFTDPSLVPAASLATFERIHPEIFEDMPWTDRRIMFLSFAADRKPTDPT